MDLEAVEEACVQHLAQVTQPVVSVSALLYRLHQDERFAALSESELVAFLRKHPLFRVIQPDEGDGAERRDELKEAGIDLGLRVILTSRIPTQTEMTSLMVEQLDLMAQALERALLEAQRDGRLEAEAKVRAILERTEKLRGDLKAIQP